MRLPFWNTEIQIEVSSWFPYGRDYQPVSVNRFYDGTLRSIAASCLDLGSEFLFMASPSLGCVGSFSREKFFRYGPDNMLNLGFLMLFGFSEKIESALMFSIVKAEAVNDLTLGVTSCSIWREGIFESKMKVVALVGNEPFYDCSEYISKLEKTLRTMKNIYHVPDISYFAEKFGYDRFLMNLENVSPYNDELTRILLELKDIEAQEIVGGSPRIDFPPFFSVMVVAVENNNKLN